MDQEAIKTKADQLARRMYRCRAARGVIGQAEKGVLNQTRKLAVILGEHEVHGAVAREMEGKGLHHAVEFVLFTDAGVVSVPVVVGELDHWHESRTVEVPGGVRLLPAERIRSVSVGDGHAEEWQLELLDPPFTVEVDGLGSILVDQNMSDQSGVRDELFAHVRGVLASRR